MCIKILRTREPLPHSWIDRKRRNAAGRQVRECPVVGQPAVPEESRQHRQSLIGEGLINEWGLAFERFERAARRKPIFRIELRIDDLRKEVCNVGQPKLTFFYIDGARLSQ